MSARANLIGIRGRAAAPAAEASAVIGRTKECRGDHRRLDARGLNLPSMRGSIGEIGAANDAGKGGLTLGAAYFPIDEYHDRWARVRRRMTEAWIVTDRGTELVTTSPMLWFD